MSHPFRLLSIVGARPNFMKVAPIAAELGRRGGRIASTIVHTGQHYDEQLSKVFFEDLAIPRPDVNLNVGSSSHAQQTAAIMAAFEPVLLEHRADLVLVVGDVNSTIACALVAVKLGVPVAHVEAGLRSFDRTMPEEVNRILTDQLSELLFTTEASAETNLRREGVSAEKIHFVGNVMIDTLMAHRERAAALNVRERLGLPAGDYGLLTLHRPSNVDDPVSFERLLGAIAEVAEDVPIVFPVHPRTRPVLLKSPAAAAMIANRRMHLLDPLGYLEFLNLLQRATVVLTDSGGIQEETTILGVPCLTLRDNTERPVTVTHGTNRMVGTRPDAIVAGWREIKGHPCSPGAPPLWDGGAARRIVDVLTQFADR